MEDPQMDPSALVRDPRLSPLGCYIAAHRVGRIDWARYFAPAAARQHHACPLYHAATLSLLPADLYPLAEPLLLDQPTVERRRFTNSIVMN